jgi:hypothetical protein
VLYVFGFDRIGVVVADLYIVDPDPLPGQEGPEQGVRLEVRLLERGELQGGIYSAQPIAVDRPVWRADLLEAVDHPGTLDRAHHHPTFSGWDPCDRVFEAALSADPLGWVGARLSDLDGLLAAGGAAGTIGPTDAGGVRAAVPEILDAVRHLLDQVRTRSPGEESAADDQAGVRVSWL